MFGRGSVWGLFRGGVSLKVARSARVPVYGALYCHHAALIGTHLSNPSCHLCCLRPHLSVRPIAAVATSWGWAGRAWV